MSFLFGRIRPRSLWILPSRRGTTEVRLIPFSRSVGRANTGPGGIRPCWSSPVSDAHPLTQFDGAMGVPLPARFSTVTGPGLLEIEGQFHENFQVLDQSVSGEGRGRPDRPRQAALVDDTSVSTSCPAYGPAHAGGAHGHANASWKSRHTQRRPHPGCAPRRRAGWVVQIGSGRGVRLAVVIVTLGPPNAPSPARSQDLAPFRYLGGDALLL